MLSCGAGSGGRRHVEWRDAFFPDPHIAVSEPHRHGDGWAHLTAHFPPADGLPGDPPTHRSAQPTKLRHSIGDSAAHAARRHRNDNSFGSVISAGQTTSPSPGAIIEKAASLLRYGFLATAATAVEALAVVEAGLKMGSKASGRRASCALSKPSPPTSRRGSKIGSPPMTRFAAGGRSSISSLPSWSESCASGCSPTRAGSTRSTTMIAGSGCG